jgi:hypothetical protein
VSSTPDDQLSGHCGDIASRIVARRSLQIPFPLIAVPTFGLIRVTTLSIIKVKDAAAAHAAAVVPLSRAVSAVGSC